MPIDAMIGEIHGPTAPQSQSFTRTQMGSMYVNPADIEPARYHVYVYTISKQEWVVQQAPLIPYLIIPACGPGEPYKKVVEIPHPMMQIERHPDKNEAIIYRHEAERVAESICDPNNPTLDQDYLSKSPLGLGVNLHVQGVFWSRNDPPTREELTKAEKRIEKYHASLIERARTLEISNPKLLEELINPDYHAAAERFGLETPWHRKLVSKAECPVCAESVNPSAAICKHCGAILDAEKAAKYGVTEESLRSSRAQESAPAGEESPAQKRRPRA